MSDTSSYDTATAAVDTQSSSTDARASGQAVLLGVLLWGVAMVAIVLVYRGELYEVFLGLSRYWVLAYGVGCLAVLLSLVISAGRGKIGGVQAIATLGAFISPVAVLLIANQAMVSLWSGAKLFDSFGGNLGILALFVFAASLAVASVVYRRHGGDFVRVFFLPPMVIAVAAVVLVAVSVFSSTQYRYHKAFGFQVTDVARQDGQLKVTGVLEVKKPGGYAFECRYYQLSSESMEPTPGELVWLETTPGEPVAGRFPFALTWDGAGELEDLGGYVDIAMGPVFAIRRAGEGGELLRQFHVPLSLRGDSR